MSTVQHDRLVFLLFCSMALFFHYSSTSPVHISNEYLLKLLNLVNAVLYLSFKPIEVFFHEASHGLAAIATGRDFISISLTLSGSGHVTLQEADSLRMAIVAFSGYLGAAVWGYLIYLSSLKSRRISRLLLIAFCLSFIYKSDGLYTVLILGIIIAVFTLSWLLDRFGAWLLRFIGIFVMVSAVYSPIYLFSYAHAGDHVTLQKYTGVPAMVWIFLWLMISLFCLFEALRATQRVTQAE